MRPRPLVLSLILLGLAACGGTDQAAPRATAPTRAASPAAPRCSPNGTTLEITAEKNRFDKDCLAAPADMPFTIEFTNKDPEPVDDRPGHNVRSRAAPESGRSSPVKSLSV